MYIQLGFVHTGNLVSRSRSTLKHYTRPQLVAHVSPLEGHVQAHRSDTTSAIVTPRVLTSVSFPSRQQDTRSTVVAAVHYTPDSMRRQVQSSASAVAAQASTTPDSTLYLVQDTKSTAMAAVLSVPDSMLQPAPSISCEFGSDHHPRNAASSSYRSYGI